MFLTCIFGGNSMNNLLSHCGLTDARMRASEKDLPVIHTHPAFEQQKEAGKQAKRP